jgi:hypothetical protein
MIESHPILCSMSVVEKILVLPIDNSIGFFFR